MKGRRFISNLANGESVVDATVATIMVSTVGSKQTVCIVTSAVTDRTSTPLPCKQAICNSPFLLILLSSPHAIRRAFTVFYTSQLCTNTPRLHNTPKTQYCFDTVYFEPPMRICYPV